ncbi:MAG: Rpn family recombination-promoting nuclease/putative transposase [Clostridia bacterium]|nr:Rpn family recombination-promoting nuclease/putative transposase [Clostridia bacterium]
MSTEEILSGFYRDDKLIPVITLVIYYGQEEWTHPLKLSELFKDTLFKDFADDMPMYLLDVRHMTKEKLDAYSPLLKAFFVILVYEGTSELDNFIRQNAKNFSNLPAPTIDALIEITHSKELERFKKEYRTPEGGVNVCYGIQTYGNQREMIGTIHTLQRHGFSVAETVKDIMTEYRLKEQDAEKVVKENWREAVSASETK